MYHINISDLKRLAKKERKNNPSIKNHADSLDIIAKRYNYDSWNSLLDSSKIMISGENINQDKFNNEKLLFRATDGRVYTFANNETADTCYITDKFSRLTFIPNTDTPEQIIINAIEQFNKEVKYFINLLKYDVHEELYTYLVNMLLSTHYDETNKTNNIFIERAKRMLRLVCYVFRCSSLTKNFENFRSLFELEKLLNAIIDNKLETNHRVLDFLETIYYDEPLKKGHLNISYDHLQQSGFLSMHISLIFSHLDLSVKAFNPYKSNLHVINNLIMNDRTTQYALIVAKEGLSTTNVAFQKYNILKEQSKNFIDTNILRNVLIYFENN
jgi:hypothetical protein